MQDMYRCYYQIVGIRLYISLFLSACAALSESFGIVLFLPILSSALGNENFKGIMEIGPFQLSIYTLVLIIFSLFLVKSILTFLALRYNAKTRSIFLKTLKIRVFESVLEQSYLEFIESKSGEYQSLLNEQVARALQSYIQFSHMNAQLVQLTIYAGIGFFTSLIFGFSAVLISTFMAMLLMQLNKRVRNLSNVSTRYSVQLSEDFGEISNNFKYLKLTGRVKTVQKRIIQSIEELSTAHRKVGTLAGFTLAIKEPLGILVLVGATTISYFFGSGDLTTFLTSAALFYRAFGCVMAAQISRQNTLEYFSSFTKILDFLLHYKKNKVHQKIVKKNIDVDSPDFSIKVENVSLILSNKEVLKNINMELSDKSINAIVGPSGSGKSTLAQIICGLIEPSSGRVIACNEDLSVLNLNDWRDCLGYVSPEGYLFSGTIAQNIAFDFLNCDFEPEIQAKIRSCLGKVGLLDHVDTLPLGIHTDLAEKGASLSLGQRQRLQIARELYNAPRVLVLDEATNALDNESQKTVTNLLSQLKRHMMVIIIAHRTEALEGADYVWYVRDGRISQVNPKNLNV